MGKYYKECSKCKTIDNRENTNAYLCAFCKDHNRSPHLWDRITKKIFKERGKFCEICKTKNNLHVHHIDKNRENNNENNLRVLCRQCHPSVHGNEGRQIKEIYIGPCGTRILYD